VLALAVGLAAVGRLTALAGQYIHTEVALRKLAVSLEKHRAARGTYPLEMEQLADNPARDTHYVPLPADAEGDLLWAWRVVDDPLGDAAAVLTKSGHVRWVSPRELSAELDQSVRCAVPRPEPAPAPATAPASRPTPATAPTQPSR
jgi:hypothetical protein